MLQQQHQSQEHVLSDFLLARQQRNELSASVNVPALSRYLGCMLQGMSVRAREGAERDDLDSIIDTLMAMWPTLTGLCQTKR